MLTSVFFHLQKVTNEMDVIKAKKFQPFFDTFFLACKIPDFYVEPLISEFLFKKKKMFYSFFNFENSKKGVSWKATRSLNLEVPMAKSLLVFIMVT